MAEISIFLSVIFILSFLLIFWFFRHENQKEEKKDRLTTLVMISILFSLIVTFFFAFVLFVIMGSTSLIDKIFSLNIDSKQLLLIGISFLIYWITIDNFFEILFEYTLGKNIFAILFLALSRGVAFYIIGILLKLNGVINMTISIGVPAIIFVLEMLYFFKNNKS